MHVIWGYWFVGRGCVVVCITACYHSPEPEFQFD